MTTPKINGYKPPSPPVRAGSQDAFKKPSVVGGQRVEYKPPSIGCVGVLKDRRQHHNDY